MWAAVVLALALRPGPAGPPARLRAPRLSPVVSSATDADADADADGKRATLSWREDSPAEVVVPDVALTRSRDGTTGTATFRFERPRITSLNNVWKNGLITGLWLRDEEGTLVTQDVSLSFDKGQPSEVRAILVLKSAEEWERYLRFMRRYAEEAGLEFEPSR